MSTRTRSTWIAAALASALTSGGACATSDDPTHEGRDIAQATQVSEPEAPPPVNGWPRDGAGNPVAYEVENEWYTAEFRLDGEWRVLDYQVVHGNRIFEGDILLGRVGEPLGMTSWSHVTTAAHDTWPNATVPYQILETSWPSSERTVMRERILAAISTWETSTRIDFVPATNCGDVDADCLIIKNGTGGCYSSVGHASGHETVLTGVDCSTSAVVHELGHVIGLHHEQTRLDRDAHITVQLDNIIEDKKHNFAIPLSGSTPVGPYDIDSIMHYYPFGFTANGRLTIERNDSWGLFGSWQQQWRTGVDEDTRDLLVADFDGDGKTDVVRTTGTRWELSHSAQGEWQVINSSAFRAANLRVGNFDGNQRADIFRADGDHWYVSYDGTGPWTVLNTSTYLLDSLALGDFDGDGRTDVFRPTGSEWLVSRAGTGPWQHLGSSGFGLAALRFGDFDGDGKTDVFRTTGSEWVVSYGGAGPWTHLNTSSTPLAQLLLIDTDGDARTDVLRIQDVSEAGEPAMVRYTVARSGSQAWQPWGQYGVADLAKVRVGDFDGRVGEELLVDGYYRTSSSLSPGDINGATRLYFPTLQLSHGAQDPWQLWADLADVPPLSTLLVGDFDHDGRDDLFQATGTQFRMKSAGRSEWRFLRFANDTQSSLRLGDFNHDGQTDVFRRTETNQWQVSYGGATPWQNLGSSGAPLTRLGLGDFNGDGTTDILWTTGSEWRVSYGGMTVWQPIQTSTLLMEGMRIGDFNGDGTSDLVRSSEGKWLVSWGATSAWQVLGSSGFQILDLRLGDFNGDHRTDIFRIKDGSWMVWLGQGTGWQAINYSAATLEDLVMGDFDGGGQTDVLGYVREVPNSP